MTIPTREPPPAGPTVPAPAPPSTPNDDSGFARSWAVVVGIDDYRNDIAALRTARADAEALGGLLRERHGYQVVVRTDADADREGLVRLLREELPAWVQTDDRVLFYFAGHGVALDGDGGARRVPSTAGRARGRRGVAAVDARRARRPGGSPRAPSPRRAGLLLRGCLPVVRLPPLARGTAATLPPAPGSYVTHPARQILTSAAHDQRALDTILDGRVLGARGDGTGHSPFAQALLDGLAGAADASQGELRGDGVITATELYLYARSRLQPDALHPEQTPQLWPMRTHGRGEFVFVPPGAPPALADAPAMAPENNPYRGLLVFDIGQKDLFFGRARLVRELREKVARHRLVAVLGPSGSGKSSLVRAGLVPALRNSPPVEWTVADPVRPGRDPQLALAATLAGPLREPADTLARALRDEPGALRARMAAWRARTGGTLLLVLDQFEELFTETLHGDDRDRFVAQLTAALGGDDVGLRVVATARADFEPRFLDTPLCPPWMEGRYNVRPMSADELREAIEGPATVRALVFEAPEEGTVPELVRRLIDDVLQMPGALPLLSFTLGQLYLKSMEAGRGDRTLREEDYDALGTAVGALRKRADEICGALGPDDQATMRRLMLRLGLFEGGQATRRRVPRWELAHADNAEQARIDALTKRLVDERLIVSGDEPVLGPFVEAAHDALLLGWTRLWEWVREARPTPPEHRRLTEAVEEWREDDESARRLWDRNPGLPPFERALRETPVPLAKDEGRFVSASRSRRRRRRVQTAAGAALAVATVALVVSLFSRQSTTSRSQRAEGFWEAAQAEQQRDPLRALLLLDRAVELAPDDDRRLSIYLQAAVHQARAAPTQIVQLPGSLEDVTVSRSGRMFAASTLAGGALVVGDLQTSMRFPTPFDTMTSGYGVHGPPALSMDDELAAVVYSSGDSTRPGLYLWAWNTRTGKGGAPIQVEISTPLEAVFAPGGDAVLLFAAEDDEQMMLSVNLSTRHTTVLSPAPVAVTEGRCLSPDPDQLVRAHERVALPVPGIERSLLLMCSNDPDTRRFAVQVLETRNGNLLRSPRPLLHPGPLVGLAVSGDGGTATTTSSKGDRLEVRTWDMRTGQLGSGPIALERDERVVGSSRDGKLVYVAGNRDAFFQVSEINASGRQRRTLINRWHGTDSEDLKRVRLTSDGRYLLHVSETGEARGWDLNTGQEILRPETLATGGARKGSGRAAWTIAPSGDVIGVAETGAILRWSLLGIPRPEQVQARSIHWVRAAAFSPRADRVLLLQGGPGAEVMFLRMERSSTGESLWERKLDLPDAAIPLLRWSLDGKSILSAVRLSDTAEGYRVTAWDVATGVPRCDFELMVTELLDAAVGAAALSLGWHTDGAATVQRRSFTACRVVADSATHPRSQLYAFDGSAKFYLISGPGGTAIHDLEKSTGVGPLTEDPASNSLFRDLFQQGTYIPGTPGGKSARIALKGDTITIIASPRTGKWTLQTPDGLAIQPEAPLYRPADTRIFSWDGRWFVIRDSMGFIGPDSSRVFDGSSGWPITGALLRDRQILAQAFSPNASSLWTAWNDGSITRWAVTRSVQQRPRWSKDLGEALTGLRLTEAGTEILSPEEHVRIRAAFFRELRDATERGDPLARLLENRFVNAR